MWLNPIAVSVKHFMSTQFQRKNMEQILRGETHKRCLKKLLQFILVTAPDGSISTVI